MNKRFFSVKQLMQAVVRAHEDGKPLNPAGVRQYGLTFAYADTKLVHKNEASQIGNQVASSRIADVIAAVNRILDEGGEVDGRFAYRVRGVFHCPVKTKESLDANAQAGTSKGSSGFVSGTEETSSVESNDVNTSEDTVVEEPSTEPSEESITGSEEVAETVEEEVGTTPTEDETVNETEGLSTDTESESGLSDGASVIPEATDIDWDAVSAMTKAEIDAYAANNYDVNLDGRKTKSAMIADFKAALGVEDDSIN